jgi:hypothetical protein
MSSSTINSVHDLHQFVDDSNRKTPFLIDSITGSVVTIGYTHHEIHDGNTYAFRAKVTNLADNGEYKTRIVIPAGMTFHLKEIDPWIDNAHGEIELIEGPTASGGAAVTVYNRNRVSTATSGITVAQSATSTGGIIPDVITFGGGGANVASKAGGYNTLGMEWILNSSTVYVMNMKNLSGASATISLRATGYKET